MTVTNNGAARPITDAQARIIQALSMDKQVATLLVYPDGSIGANVDHGRAVQLAAEARAFCIALAQMARDLT